MHLASQQLMTDFINPHEEELKYRHERKLCILRIKEIKQIAKGTSQSFIETVRVVWSPGLGFELFTLQKFCKFDRLVQVTFLAGQPVHQEEDIATAGDAVADARTFQKQSPLPGDISTPLTTSEVLLLTPK